MEPLANLAMFKNWNEAFEAVERSDVVQELLVP